MLALAARLSAAAPKANAAIRCLAQHFPRADRPERGTELRFALPEAMAALGR